MKSDEALKAQCIADTCFLSNFIFTGQGLLIRLLLEQPVNITSAILDPLEPSGHDFLLVEPFSELLRPLYFAQKRNDDKYRSAELPLQQFLSGQGQLWSPVTLTEEELKLGISFATTDI